MTPRPTSNPKDAGSVDKDVFVDLSPLAASLGVTEKQNEREFRHPIVFTPPPFSLEIDLSQPIEPVDAIPASYAFPSQPEQMMAQPIVDGRKAVKFAEPIVQDHLWRYHHQWMKPYARWSRMCSSRKKMQPKAPSSSPVAHATTSVDVQSSATPSSVRQARVVQPPPPQKWTMNLQ
ncbi:hypothetical protein CFC21_001552 [Triticum aestivum]|uniref:Uncharacterized protein n=1 Tax=Triticum aestivum TaxID=4565 RepID=A0A3B5XY21_WHEAT|nr:hypothetical protein CFC21_001552 [Triticum aestivum]